MFAVALFLAVGYTLTKSCKLRLLLMVLGLITPIVVIDPEMAILMAFSPILAFQALSGHADGEFYAENMPEVTAVGLWMILCLVFAIFQLHTMRRQTLGAPCETFHRDQLVG